MVLNPIIEEKLGKKYFLVIFPKTETSKKIIFHTFKTTKIDFFPGTRIPYAMKSPKFYHKYCWDVTFRENRVFFAVNRLHGFYGVTILCNRNMIHQTFRFFFKNCLT